MNNRINIIRILFEAASSLVYCAPPFHSYVSRQFCGHGKPFTSHLQAEFLISRNYRGAGTSGIGDCGTLPWELFGYSQNKQKEHIVCRNLCWIRVMTIINWISLLQACEFIRRPKIFFYRWPFIYKKEAFTRN